MNCTLIPHLSNLEEMFSLSLADSELLESRRIFLITACYEIKYK